MSVLSIELENEQATLALGEVLAKVITKGVVYLNGNLGMGKTTLTRGWLRARGYSGSVKSPTYTLVECYDLDGSPFYHFDLYRLGDPEELEYMGIRDYFTEEGLCVLEWPEKGYGVIPQADFNFSLQQKGQGRLLEIAALGEYGIRILASLRVALDDAAILVCNE